MSDMEENISKKIHDFDIISLIRVLISMGFSHEEITFRSHNSICSQSVLIHGIEFRHDPVREAVITMNMGLLGAQSPLPSYFKKKTENEEISKSSFVDFTGYFDHHLIRDYICNIYPEINRLFFPNWESAKRRYLQLLNLKSLGALHWLFQTVFPEIGVMVENAVLSSKVQTRPVRLGETVLGHDAIFGHKTTVALHGRRVTLYSDEEMTDTQIPWPRELKIRLENLIFPVLRPAGIDLEIFLVLKSQKRWVRLHGETYLGYDRLRSPEDAFRRIRIFKGHIGGPFRAAEDVGDNHHHKNIKTAAM